MRSVNSPLLRLLAAPWLAALLIAAALPSPARADDAPATSQEAPKPQEVSKPQVERIVKEMKSDPALNKSHIEHELRWKKRDEEDPKPRQERPHWLIELARWLANASRGLAWVLGAVAVAVFAVFVWRWASVRADAQRVRAEMRPSFVNELDIRPESLPADIAGSARALHRRGETRAALSLLYRGALSRLVHEHAVPIRAASTEGECLRLAARVLPAAGSAYFARLVSAWQTEVYAGRAADAAAVAALCDEFDANFAIATPADAGTPAMPAAAGAAS